MIQYINIQMAMQICKPSCSPDVSWLSMAMFSSFPRRQRFPRLRVGLAHHETCQAHVTDFAVTSAVQHDVPRPLVNSKTTTEHLEDEKIKP